MGLFNKTCDCGSGRERGFCGHDKRSRATFRTKVVKNGKAKKGQMSGLWASANS